MVPGRAFATSAATFARSMSLPDSRSSVGGQYCWVVAHAGSSVNTEVGLPASPPVGAAEVYGMTATTLAWICGPAAGESV